MMDDLMRSQYANAQTSFARRQQASALPGNELPVAAMVPPQANPQAEHAVAPPHSGHSGQGAWMLNGPGQMAPREHFNVEPAGGGAWRIYPPGRQAPAHGPQGSMPSLPTSFDHFKSLGDELDRTFGKGAPPPVPGPFPSAPPRPQPGPTSVPRMTGRIPGLG